MLNAVALNDRLARVAIDIIYKKRMYCTKSNIFIYYMIKTHVMVISGENVCLLYKFTIIDQIIQDKTLQ